MILSISFFAADDGVDLALARLLRQVDAVAQRRRARLPGALAVLMEILFDGAGKDAAARALLLGRFRRGRGYADLLVQRAEQRVEVHAQHTEQAHGDRSSSTRMANSICSLPTLAPRAVAVDGELARLVEDIFRAGVNPLSLTLLLRVRTNSVR